MIQKKIFLFTILLLISSLNIFAQQNIKESVAIIRPVYDIKTEKFLTDYATSLDIDGYDRAAAMLNAYVRGGFGSGFVYTDSNTGKSYVITSKQLVQAAKHVTVEFTSADKQTKTYTACPIIATDIKTGLAAIALPKTDTPLPSVSFSTTKIEDGLDIYSAGYTNVNKEPLWQLNKGIVSNAKMIFQSSETSYIQHTALVSQGGTGSLLLVKDNVSGQYQALGMNVWKPTGREDVNVAVPASDIKNFIHTYLSEKQTPSDLTREVNRFIDSAKNGYEALLSTISYNYINGISPYAAYDYMTNLPKAIKSDIDTQLQGSNPLEAMQIAIAYYTAQKLAQTPATVQSISEKNDSAEVKLLLAGKEMDSKWIREHGTWRVVRFLSMDYAQKLQEKNISKGYDLMFMITANAGIPLNSKESTYYGMTFSAPVFTYMLFDFAFSVNGLSLYEIDWLHYNSASPNYIWNKYTYGSLELRAGAQFPIKIADKFYLVPAAKGIIGLDITGGEADITRFGYGYLAQLEGVYKLNSWLHLLVGAGYKHKSFIKDQYANPALIVPLTAIDIHVGIAF